MLEVEGLLEVIFGYVSFVHSIPWDLLSGLHSRELISDVRYTSQAGVGLVCLTYCRRVAHLPGPGARQCDPLPRLRGKKKTSFCKKCFLIEGCPGEGGDPSGVEA